MTCLSDSVMRIVHAFGDEGRRAAVRRLAERVRAMEQALRQIEEYEAGRGDFGSVYSMMTAHCALNPIDATHRVGTEEKPCRE